MLRKRAQRNGPLPAGGELPPGGRNRDNGLAAIVARVRAAIELLAPFGYEDGSGFHIGIKPVQDKSSQCLRAQEQDEAPGNAV